MSPNSSHPVQRLHPVGGDIVAAPGGATLDDLARISAGYVLGLESRVKALEDTVFHLSETVFHLRGVLEKYWSDSELYHRGQDKSLTGHEARISNLEWRTGSLSAQVKARQR